MARQIYVDAAPVMAPHNGMGLLTFTSGGEEFSFVLSFHALCGMIPSQRNLINALCDSSRDAKVIELPEPRGGRSGKPKRVPA